MEIKDIILEYSQDNGDFSEVAHTSSILRNAVSSPGMTYAQKEAINMICNKLACIAHGNPHKIDHWRDIAVYATLAVREQA